MGFVRHPTSGWRWRKLRKTIAILFSCHRCSAIRGEISPLPRAIARYLQRRQTTERLAQEHLSFVVPVIYSETMQAVGIPARLITVLCKSFILISSIERDDNGRMELNRNFLIQGQWIFGCLWLLLSKLLLQPITAIAYLTFQFNSRDGGHIVISLNFVRSGLGAMCLSLSATETVVWL